MSNSDFKETTGVEEGAQSGGTAAEGAQDQLQRGDADTAEVWTGWVGSSASARWVSVSKKHPVQATDFMTGD